MSVTHEQDIECGRCGAAISVFLADSLNAGRHPALRERLLAGQLHRFTCGACGHSLVIDKELLYFDYERGHYFYVFPVTRIGDRATCIAEARRAYDLSFGAHAPPSVRALGSSMMVRVCFGLDQLRDKVVADDANLSDLALEELKCRVLAAREELQARQVVGLWLVRADDATLELVAQTADGTPGPRLAIARSFYDEVAAEGHDALVAMRPALVHGPHISMLGLVLEA